MKILESFRAYIDRDNLFSSKDKLLLAVSGGVDSVVLCELCHQSGYSFTIAHCNFQLRGEESDRDEQFVRDLGKKYGVGVFVKKFNTEQHASDKKISIQESARDLRYRWFFELAYRVAPGNDDPAKAAVDPVPGWHGPDGRCFIVTAHHADDNAETVLMNFCRGTGLHGLTGIPSIGTYMGSDIIRRPLLEFSKDELMQFARQHKLDYVEDSSNLSSKYTRNYFRNEIFPAIGKAYPQVKQNLLDNIDRFKEIEKLYKLAVEEIKKKLCKQKGDELHIPVKQLMGYRNRALIYEIINSYGFSEKQVEEVVKLAESESGRYIQSPDQLFRIIKHRHWFIISPVETTDSENIIIVEETNSLQFAVGSLQFSKVAAADCLLPVADSTACFDAAAIQFPLLLRKWKTGDYFYPLGMKKKKKLARFFIDRKLSKTDKEKIWVLEMNRRIIWVVGMRIDDRFKITPKTKTVLKIELTGTV